MGTANVPQLGGSAAEPSTLSTGERVALPLSTDARMDGVVLSADRSAVDGLLPAGLSPIRATPRRAAVTLLCVEYSRIGDDVMEPYNEFAVMLPATRGESTVPLASVLSRGVSGYVWDMPVTSAPAKALGVDIWGYPKSVANIEFDERGGRRRMTVADGGDHYITVETARPPLLDRTDEGYSYTVKDGQVLRETTELDGELGLWPYSGAFSVTLGDHPKAETLRGLDLGGRALLRFGADAEFVVGPGEPVGSV